jgi:flagellar M-ring protein FliF
MNEWLKKVREQLKALWAKWSRTQKIILFSIIGATVLAIILLVSLSATPAMVALFSSPVTDADARTQINARLDQSQIKFQLRADNIYYVADETVARRARMILNTENLIPTSDPWAIFDTQSWTTTDFERDVNLQRAVQKQLKQHIEALDGVEIANVTLVVPKTELFVADQKPTSASIIITPSIGSDIATNRKKLEGIQRLVKTAVAGLTDENLVITDNTGVQLNDFAGMVALDNLDLAKRELKLKNDLQTQYRNEITDALGKVFSPDRVQVFRIEVNFDMSKETSVNEEYTPPKLTPGDKYTSPTYGPYAQSSQSVDEHFLGSGFNPEGPTGTEGQTTPTYSDLSNLNGKYDKTSNTVNNVVNKKVTNSEKQPYEIKGISAGITIDGTTVQKYDKNGKVMLDANGAIQRVFVPVSDADIAKAKSVVQAAIGFNRDRGDTVEVQAMQFDHSAQFAKEDAVFKHQAQVRSIIYIALGALGALLILVLAYRLIAKELERRRRLREEELARQHQAMREAALRTAEEQGVEVELSVEDRARLEMQENAANMAREHPEDVAQLIRTWLVEE